MRVSIFVLAMLVPMAAYANWEVEDVTDEQGELFVAFAVDQTDTIEVQVSCDELLGYELLFSVYTGIASGQKKALPEPVSLDITIGAIPYHGLVGTVADINDEKVIDVSESDFPQIRDLVRGIAKGKDFTLSYADAVWTVSGEDAAGAFPMIVEHCP